MLKKLKEKKWAILLIIIILSGIGVSLILIFNKEDKSVRLNSSFEILGRKFYEDFYYDSVGNDDNERKDFLNQYKDIGVTINLKNLKNYEYSLDEKDKIEYKNDKTGKPCNLETSKVTIYPQSPYGKKNYKIEFELDCK